MKKFEDIWKEANEEADLEYDPKGVLARSLILYSALKKRIDPFLEKQKPEIPEFMAKAVEEFKKQPDSYKGFSKVTEVWSWLNEYQMNNDDFGICGLNNKFFVLAHFAINGYTVAKEKRFYLKHKSVLIFDPDSDDSDVDELYLGAGGNFVPYQHLAKIFTQSQIDSMETGSYEQIEVQE